jgi:hypothetical protein
MPSLQRREEPLLRAARDQVEAALVHTRAHVALPPADVVDGLHLVRRQVADAEAPKPALAVGASGLS